MHAVPCMQAQPDRDGSVPIACTTVWWGPDLALVVHERAHESGAKVGQEARGVLDVKLAAEIDECICIFVC